MKPSERARASWALSVALTLSSAMAACDSSVVGESSAHQKSRPDVDGGRPDRTIAPHRSLVVTELAILERFTFARVMNALAAQSGVAGATGVSLFQTWWDSQNPAPGIHAGPHCDDTYDSVLGTTRNGYPYACRAAPSEGYEASCDPFATGSVCAYVPIGLFNRFDLAPADGAHCGEYRIVFARASGITTGSERNLIIFEASLPNPHPVQGLKGCKPIVDFWADLSSEDELDARADALEEFYFEGHGVIDRVVDVTHFGDGPSFAGQIRTNQFLQTSASPRAWSLREFRLRRTCDDGICTSIGIEPDTNKTNPWGGLFDPASTHANAAAFQAQFSADVANLSAPAIGAFSMTIPDLFNSAQSEASGSTDTNYLARFGPGPSTFHDSIAAAAASVPSTLTPTELVARAQALSCAGCHRLSNNAPLGGGLVWPPSLGFTHVTEREPETVDGVIRYRISIALEATFLPIRQRVMEDFLNDRPLNARSVHARIGGFETH